MRARRAGVDLTPDAVEELFAIGILHPEERVELIGGELVTMAAMGGDHVECVVLLNEFLNGVPGKSWFVSVQNAVQLADGYAPEPAIALIRRRVYHGALPVPADVFLLIEVSDTTLFYDRTVKLPLYAAAGIPEVWIAEVKRRVIVRYSEPTPEGYRIARPFGSGETIASLVLPAIGLPVAAVFGAVADASAAPEE